MTSCRDASAAAAEPLLGSALVERTLLVVEQPGSWGREAVSENRMATVPAASLRGLDADPAVRVMVARRARGFATPGARKWWRIDATPAGVTASQGQIAVDEPLTLAALASHTSPASEEILFICTNGKRDRCCAEAGRDLVHSLTDDRVWEISHLRGHRFAPTALRLSDGVMMGRLSQAAAISALDSAWAPPPSMARGRVGRSAPEQVAEWQVMLGAKVPLSGLTPRLEAGSVVVSSASRRWRVEIRERRSVPRPASCGGEPQEAVYWSADGVVELESAADDA